MLVSAQARRPSSALNPPSSPFPVAPQPTSLTSSSHLLLASYALIPSYLRLSSATASLPSHGVQIEGVVEKEAHLSAVERKRP